MNIASVLGNGCAGETPAVPVKSCLIWRRASLKGADRQGRTRRFDRIAALFLFSLKVGLITHYRDLIIDFFHAFRSPHHFFHLAL
jgi:hypothetical protein